MDNKEMLEQYEDREVKSVSLGKTGNQKTRRLGEKDFDTDQSRMLVNPQESKENYYTRIKNLSSTSRRVYNLHQEHFT